MACSPATPAPSTRTFAGGMVPAAVMNSGKNLGRRVAPTRARQVPRDQRLGGQGVHRLGARDAGDQVEGQRGGPGVRGCDDRGEVGNRLQEGQRDGARLEQLDGLGMQGPHGGDHVRDAQCSSHVLGADHLGAGLAVVLVGRVASQPGPRLDGDRQAEGRQASDRFGDQRHAILAGPGLGRHENLHGVHLLRPVHAHPRASCRRRQAYVPPGGLPDRVEVPGDPS